jgi:hypothetical protein
MFWTGNLTEAGHSIDGYESLWLPRGLLATDCQGEFIDALFGASRASGRLSCISRRVSRAPPRKRIGPGAIWVRGKKGVRLPTSRPFHGIEGSGSFSTWAFRAAVGQWPEGGRMTSSRRPT